MSNLMKENGLDLDMLWSKEPKHLAAACNEGARSVGLTTTALRKVKTTIEAGLAQDRTVAKQSHG